LFHAFREGHQEDGLVIAGKGIVVDDALAVIAEQFDATAFQALELPGAKPLAEMEFSGEFFDIMALFPDELAVVLQDSRAVHAGQDGDFAWKGRREVEWVATASQGFDVEAEAAVHAADAVVIQKHAGAIGAAAEVAVAIDIDVEVIWCLVMLVPGQGCQAFYFRRLQEHVETAAAAAALQARIALVLRDVDFHSEREYVLFGGCGGGVCGGKTVCS
jgi:hypothetical protein